MNRLKDKVAVITGGNSGVGAATAKLFAAEGATVVITARREAALTAVAEEIKAAGGTVLAVSTDISKSEDSERLMQMVIDKFGKIDILINNAGILEEGLKPIDRFSDEDLDRIVETNQKGTMRVMRAATSKMQSGASIVNVASVAGAKGCGGAAYVSSKAAIIGITKHTALRFQSQGIRCNAVCPGTIITPMVAATDPATLDQDMIGSMAMHSNMKTQPCMPQDVANILLFLASDESRAITGQILVTDFGSFL
jgi:NAD(P)-dependent dehydrogenase (short-subunit alcohol dehydrogenase family)